MSDTTIAVNFLHSLDVQTNFTAQVTLYRVQILDNVTQLSNVLFGEVLCAGIGIDSGLSQNIVSALATDAVDVGQGDLNALVVRNINTSYTSNVFSPL